ncbi:roadblock/LC7 domain-containing protein [Streptomyces cyaneofuscatus]|uniref:roadblock/LC7 domain-containing protein n=1 Tax=Streptomyces cyaneofuscatus TaxID=66883 RepID=UPI0036B87088
MPSGHTSASLVETLTALREQVTGVSESALSTVDGLLLAADADAFHPESVAALSATTLSIGRRMALEAGGGALRDVVIRSAGRHIVVRSVGERALLTVVGDEGLDLAGLRREVHHAVERLAAILADDAPA